MAFIGLTLKDTPQIVVPAGVAGLQFRDEVQTVNALVPELKRQGIEAIVVLIHEGGLPTGDYDECPGISGPIVRIVEQFDPAVDLVVSGHTHRAYNCRIAGRLVTSADKYGTLVTEIDLVLDPASGDVREARAHNLIVRTDRFAKDSAQTQLIEQYERLAAPLAKRSVGRAFAPLTRDESPAGEMPVGQLVADAQLAATSGDGAQLALMNPGGLRATLTGDANGLVRYEDLFAVQPFYNNLVTHHAHRRTTAARARAAVAESTAAARAAGVARLQLQLGRRQAAGRTHRAGQPAPERRRRSSHSRSCASRSTASWPAAATTSPCSSKTARRRAPA